MTSYQWYYEVPSGSFDDPNNWFSGTNEPPQGPPGPGDVAGIVADPFTPTANGITVTGDGTVSNLAFEGTITLSGADLTGTDIVNVSSNGTNALAGLLTLTDGSTLAGPVGNTGTGVAMFATVEVEGGSTITGYQVESFETLLVESGAVQATIFEAAGYASAFSGFIPGSVDIAAAATVTDSLGIIGETTSDIAAMSVEGGGKWINQGLLIGYEGSVTMTISAGSTVSTGGGAAHPGGPALSIGGTGGTGTNITVTGPGSAITDANDAWIGGKTTPTISLESGGTLAIDGSLDAAIAAGDSAHLQIDASSSLLHVGTNATLGDAGAFAATVAAGGLFEVDGALVAANVASSTAGITLTGGTLSATGDAIFGQGGTATVSVGASGELSLGGALVVGELGSASLDINTGELDITGQTITAGAGGGGNGDISVEGATVSDSSGNIVIGSAGTGSLSVNTGGTVAANDLDIGTGMTGNGTVVFSGGGGNFNDVNVGGSGTGAMEVTAHATLQTSNFTAATGKVAIAAAVTVDGKGLLNAAAQLVLGGGGEATLEIQSGATAAAGSVILGEAHAGNGSLLFDSTATSVSELIYGGVFEIGALGTGDVSLAGHATAASGGLLTGTVEVGLSAGAQGTLAISGTNAALSALLLDVGGGATAAGGAGIVSLDAGGVLNAGTTTIWSTGTLMMSGGTLAGTAETALGLIRGFGAISGSLDSVHEIIAAGGVMELDGPVAGSGTLVLDAGTVDLRQGAVSTQVIQFGTSGGRLQTEALSTTAGTIEGFTFGNSILLTGTLANAGTWAAGVLTLSEGAGNVGTLAMAGPYSADSFAVTNDGTDTTIELACFATGTGIATVRGRVAVEDLRVGDPVPTISGRIAEVRWIGQRALDLRRHPRPENVMPARVRAGAFAEGVPARDLVLSPDHAVLVAGTLVPVRHLVNGASIVQETRAAVTYWHVELDCHDVLLAEGLACESYLDTGNRHAFEGQAALDLHPDFAQVQSMEIWSTRGCAGIATAPADLCLRAAHTALLARALARQPPGMATMDLRRRSANTPNAAS